MKRMLIIGLILGLCIFSGAVFADEASDYANHSEDLGVVIDTSISADNVNLTYIQNREPGQFTPETNGASQSAELTLNAQAYIPCYLKMVVTANMTKASVESFGADAAAKASDPATEGTLTFDNEVGGFVANDWSVAGHGKNAEIQPGTGYFIRACDLIKVDLFSNDTYKYQVTALPLDAVDADTSSDLADKKLDLQMRTRVDEGDWGSTHSFAADGSEVAVSQKAACESTTVYHDFRVPYLNTTAHGKYTGVVVFKAYTI